MRDAVAMYVNGRPVEARGGDAFLSLSDFLRRRERLPGTKVVCAEGDCGSCTVLVGRPASAGLNGELKYVAVCSCIQLVHQLDGAHVVTVEGLKDGDDPNPIQQSMVACGGAQCGFCTPGFVVALQQLLDDKSTPCTPERVKRGLVGNLCRCTGYDAIVKAACATDRASLKSMGERYPSVAPAAEGSLSIDAGGRKVFKPTTLDEAVAYRAANSDATIVNGATDVGVLFNKRVRDIPDALQLGGVAELRKIEAADGAIHVGATATLGELEAVALEHLPEFGRFLSWFGSPQIKAAGTLAGNVATGSPIGDSLPALHVLSAEVELASPRGRRRVNVNDFYTGYRQSVMASDELIAAIHVPLLKAGETLRLYKVSRRQDLDISSFSAAVWIRLVGEKIDDFRIAFGGVGPTVKRCPKAEDHLRGQAVNEEAFAHAAAIVWREVEPIGDVRGSKAYRCTLAANILRKAYFDLVDGYVAATGAKFKDDLDAGGTPGANAFDGSIYGDTGGDGDGTNGKAR